MHSCRPMFYTYLTTQLIRVYVCAFFLVLCVSVCASETASRQEIVAHISGWPVALVKEEGWMREGGDARLPRCPNSPEFWQPIRGEQIRPHTCFVFGELAVEAVQRQMLWPSGRSGHRTFHLLSFSISFSRMLIYTRGAASNLYE